MDNFKEVSGNYTLEEAIREAKRCLGCRVPGCKKACPISNDIPNWISELAHGNFGNAMRIIHERSNLPAVCGRVCGHERQCQGGCILAAKGEAIHIGRLERFLSDFEAEAGWTHEDIPVKDRGNVAVIGSGPAGLTIAGDLSRKGFSVEIFEMEPEPGGVLMYGIPEYRLPKEVVRREIQKIENLGVIIHTNVTIGPSMTIDALFERGFDAIFIGTGTGRPKGLDIEGGDHPGVTQAIDLLRNVTLYQAGAVPRDDIAIKPGDKVGVIGCGNTAMDAARTAVRMGASQVNILYHRTIDRMAALRTEYEDALREGIRFYWKTSVTKVHGKKDGPLGKVTLSIDGNESEMELDKLILAVGQAPAARIVSTTTGIEVDEKGYVLTRDTPYGMSTRKGVFAGGDVTNRPATVVHAMRDAKMVAEGIAMYVDAIKLMKKIDNR